MAGADLESYEVDSKICPNCNATFQGHAKKGKCSNCGERVVFINLWDMIRKEDEILDQLTQKIQDWNRSLEVEI